MLKHLTLFLTFFSSLIAFSQTVERQDGPIIICPAGEFDGHHHVPAADWIREAMQNHQSSLLGNETSCANIQVTYNGFTPEAEAAFQAAVDIWESSLSSDVTIKVDANWTVLGVGILGSAGPAGVFRFFDNAPDNNFYAAALADKISGIDQDPGEPDINASFNSDFDWYLGTDGNTPNGQYDLTSVVLHELGHGLGFVSSKDYDEDTGVGSFGLGFQQVPLNYDEFLTSGPNGSSLLDLTNNSVTLGDAFTSNNVYNDSPEAIIALGGTAPRIYAPNTYAGGSSISHWNESTFTAGDPNSLMTPQIGSGEAIHNPGAITLGLFEDMGWTLCESVNEDCAIDPLTLDGPGSICPGETTIVEVIDNPTIPVNGAIAIEFLDVVNQEIINLTGVTLPYSFDNDLNGVLSANSLDPFIGEFELTAFIYTDVDDLEGSTCATAIAPVTVFFLESTDPACNGEACSVDPLTLNGPESICPGETTTVETLTAAEVPSGGGIAIQFIEVASQDGINLTGVTLPYTFDNDLNGLLSANDIDPFLGEYELTVFVYTNVNDLAGSACAIASSALTVFFLDENDPTCNSNPIACEDWETPSPTTGYNDFNTEFGGAPCDDGSGCPFNEIQGFEVWGSEAYSVDNFIAGGSYTFSMCNGPGAGSWDPDFTIIAPSGTIDAFGPGDGCSISWTATEDGTYLIVINEIGNCGVGNTIDNGYPALTCEDGTADCSTNDPCSIDPLVLNGSESICPEETTTVETTNTAEVPAGGGIGIQFIEVASQDGINLTGVTLPYTFDNDLNGVLSANSLDPFEGEYELTAFVYTDVDDIQGSTCAISTIPVSVFFLDENDPACDVTPIPCDEWETPSPTTGYNDFNTEFGGAPCDDGTGCPFNEIQGFEVWGSEAYSVDNFIAGGSYTFSMCNGPGAGSWVPDFTIIAPSGTIDAFGPGDGCSISWTATEDGTYLIVINEEGNCGVGNTIDNGYPALTCVDGTADCSVDPCSIEPLTLDGPDSICPEETTTVETNNPAEVPAGGGIAIEFLNVATQDGINLTGVDLPYTFDNDLNGILSANSIDPFEGEYELTAFVYTDVDDLANSTCATAASAATVYFLEQDDPACVNSVNDKIWDNAWDIYPNPANGEVTVNLKTVANGEVSITLYDVSGRIVQQEVNMRASGDNNTWLIDVSSLNQGVYYVVLENPVFKATKPLLINK